MTVALVIIRRLAALAGVLVAVTLFTFVISNLIPGDPAQMMSGPRATRAQVDETRHRLGLDRPLPVQYAAYVGAMVHGDLGTSIATGRPVSEELLSRAPATLELMLLALVVSAGAGLAIGGVCALQAGRPIDTVLRLVAIGGVSTPVFWLGLVLLLVFYAGLGWLPPAGRLDPGMTSPQGVTGFYLLDSLIGGDLGAFADAAAHLVLPVATLSLASIGAYARLVRASMLEVLSQDYVRTARASGLHPAVVVLRHALPNAAVPFVTVLGTELGHLLFGSVMVETIFSWPGLGSYVLNGVFELDFPVIMGFTVLTSVAYVFANLAVDLAAMALDPRLRAPA